MADAADESAEDRALAWLQARENRVRFLAALAVSVGFWPLTLALLALLEPKTPLQAVPVFAAVGLGLAGIPLGSLILAEGRARAALTSGEPERLVLPGLIVLTGFLPTVVLVADLVRARFIDSGEVAALDVSLLMAWTFGFAWFAKDLSEGGQPRALVLAGLFAPFVAVALSGSLKTIVPAPLVFTAVLASWLLVYSKAPHLLTGVSMSTQAASNTPKLTCSFCGKSHLEVKKLVAGPNVYICNECVDLTNDVIREEAVKDAVKIPPTRADHDVLRAALAASCPGVPAVTDALATALFVQRHRAAGAATRPGRLLLVGPTGCGKSSLLAAALAAGKLPFAHTEATRLTETGYVGECVENLLAELVDAAGNAGAAAVGVLAIDGLHHLARRGPSMTGRDVSGGEVQRELLRLLDGRAAPLSYSRPRHPQQDTPRFPGDQLLVLAAATVPPEAPSDEAGLRAWLVDNGFSAELLARFERVVRVPALDKPRAALRLRAADGPLAPLHALARLLEVDLVVSDAALDALASEAAGPTGGWVIGQAAARWTERVVQARGRLVIDDV